MPPPPIQGYPPRQAEDPMGHQRPPPYYYPPPYGAPDMPPHTNEMPPRMGPPHNQQQITNN